MKTIVALLALAVLLTSCGQPLAQKGNVYDTKGLAHFWTDKEDKCVEYDFSVGNIIWGILIPGVGTVYFWGFSAMNPTRVDYLCLRENNELRFVAPQPE